jgi:hypothetical protein
MQPGGVYMCGRAAAGCDYVVARSMAKLGADGAAADTRFTESEGAAKAEFGSSFSGQQAKEGIFGC